jgi:hypothetical protein
MTGQLTLRIGILISRGKKIWVNTITAVGSSQNGSQFQDEEVQISGYSPRRAFFAWSNALPDTGSEKVIRRRAYEIYLECGEQQGRELDDWLQAEREFERGKLSRRQVD